MTGNHSIPPIARWLGSQRIDLAECGSTNDEAGRLARAGARHGTIVIAHAQRAGRGREGREWQSPPGMGLYLSAVLRPPLPLVDVPPMTLAIGIGLCDAARAVGANATLKWPNDVLVDGKKLAGVLVEAQSQGTRLESVVMGIGVNLCGALPEPVTDIAVTLERAAGAPVDREAFIAILLAHVERWVDRYVAMGLQEIIPAWQERMALGLVARATVDGTPLTAWVWGLDDDGALLLRDGGGAIHRVRSGDVEVIRPDGFRAPPELLSTSC
ncbi:MAG: biotin--[acetyl-CoA-carboxylase] ligase [Deltaproteobacteria bacterium]|nr:biotin--[acetyl-CoA-carboxylase] ligase [Deltaproteobacteria bacterium]